MNRISSRSHSVLTIYVAQKEKDNGVNSWLTVVSAKIQLVDLAGSELVGKSYLVGKQLEEAKMINKSLSALGLVIAALTSRSASSVHIPYRNSKLTRILQDSLGGTSKLSLIMTVSPSLKNANETLSTLRFGLRAKVVQNKVVKNVHRVSSGGNNICSRTSSSSSSNSNSNNNSNSSSPSKYYGNIPMSRMSTGSLRDTPLKSANYFSGRLSDVAMQISPHRIDRRLDNHSVETLALNAQLDSIETTKILKSFSEEELLVDLACDGEYDVILRSPVRCESHDSDVLSTEFIKAACTMTPEKSMENLDLTVILAETNDTHMGYSPNSCFTPDGENAADESGYTVFTPHSSKEQLTPGPDVTFLEPYLDTNLIYKCLDFQESIEPINTMSRSPTHALQMQMSKARNFERTSLNVDTGYTVKEFQRVITVPETKCYSFAEFQGIWKGSSSPEPVIMDPVSPAIQPISTSAYGSFEGKNDDKNDDRSEVKINDDLTTQLAKQLAVESIIVTAVTALLNVERETVAKLTKEIAMLTKNGASSPIPLFSPVSTVMDRSIHADVEEEKLSLLLSQQLKAQNVQLRVLSQELLTQKIFASTVSEKLSRVQASSAGATVSLSSERAGVEVLVTSLREKILELAKEGNDKDILIASLLHNRNRITEKMDNNDYIPLIPSPISITSDHPDSWSPPCTDRKPSNGILVTVTGDRSACTPGSMGPIKYVIKEPTAVDPQALLGKGGNVRDENSPSRNKVLTVVAAIEQKCSSRPSSMRFEDKSSSAIHSSSDGKVHDRQPTLTNPTVSKLKADMQFLGLSNYKGKIAVAPWRMPRPALSRLHDITSRLPLTATRQSPVVVPIKRRQITVEAVMLQEMMVVAEAKAIEEIEVEAEAEVEAEVIEEIEVEAEMIEETVVEAEVEAEVIEEVEAETEAEVTEETEVEAEVEAEVIEETKVEAEVEAEVIEEIEVEAEVIEETEVETEVEAEVIEEVELEAEAKTTEEVEVDAEAEAAAEAIKEIEVEAGVWTEIGSASVSEAEAEAVIKEEIHVEPADVRIEAAHEMDVETEENLNGLSSTDEAEVLTKTVSVTPALQDRADEQAKSNVTFTPSPQFNSHLRNMSRPPMIATTPVTPTSTCTTTWNSISTTASTPTSTSASNSPAAPTSSCSSISDSLSTSASTATAVAVPQSQPQPQPRSPVGRASAIPLRALNSPMSKMNPSRRKVLGDVITPHAPVKPMSAIASALMIPASATIIPDISIEMEDPQVVTVDQGVTSPVYRVVSFEIRSDLYDVPVSDDTTDHTSLRNTPKQLLSSLSNSEEDDEEKDHIPEITLYHSGDSDTSMNLENVRDFIDHIPSSIPEVDDSFIGQANYRDHLSQFKSTGSGKFAAEQL